MQLVASLAQIVFWTFCALLIMNYIGLFYFLRVITFLMPKDKKQSRATDENAELPTVTVLIAARNEEEVIGSKIKNTLDQNYPQHKFKIIVASDNSTDSTAEIVNGFSESSVKLIMMKERSGKLGIIDKIVPTLDSDIVVITDANVMLHPDSIFHIMEKYADPKVGAVSGNQRSVSTKTSKQMVNEETYRNFETKLKRTLAKLGMVIGCYGGIYSFRKKLFRPIGDIPMSDDMVIPLEVMGQKQKVDFAEYGLAYEGTEKSIRKEYNRRKRIIGYNLPVIKRGIKLTAKAGLLPLIIFIVYKVVRWLSPLFFIGIIAAAFSLSFTSALFYNISLIIIFILMLSFSGFLLSLIGIRVKLISQLYYFAGINLAVLHGIISVKTKSMHHWEPRG